MRRVQKDPWLPRRELGRSGLRVTPVGVGGSPLGGSPGLYGHDTSEREGVATALRALHGPFNVLDTSNAYGEGRSEARIGQAIAAAGGLPEGFVLATKVDAEPETRRFDRDRVLRSFEESLGRLDRSSVDILHLHDPEVDLTFESAMRPGGPVAALVELRDSGAVRAIGIAGGAAGEMARYVATGCFDVLLTHNRYSLVDRTADDLIDLASSQRMGVINGAPFGGGLLAGMRRDGARYAYGLGTSAQVAAASEIEEFLARRQIPIAAAALQLSVREPRIHCTLVGASSPSRIDRLVRLLDVFIPDTVWEELESYLPSREFWIGD